MSKRAHTLVNLGKKCEKKALPVRKRNHQMKNDVLLESPDSLLPAVEYPDWFGKVADDAARVDSAQTRRKREHSQATDDAEQRAPTPPKTSKEDTRSKLGIPVNRTNDTVSAPLTVESSAMICDFWDGDFDIARDNVQKDVTPLDNVSSAREVDSSSIVPEPVDIAEDSKNETDPHFLNIVNISEIAEQLELGTENLVPQNETSNSDSTSVLTNILNAPKEISSKTDHTSNELPAIRSGTKNHLLLENLSEELLSGKNLEDLFPDLEELRPARACAASLGNLSELKSPDSVPHTSSTPSRDDFHTLKPVSPTMPHRAELSTLDQHMQSCNSLISPITPTIPLASSSATSFNITDKDSPVANLDGESVANPDNPQACRRLFEVDANEVDEWPFLIPNEDGSVLEVTLQSSEGSSNLSLDDSNESINPLETSASNVSSTSSTSSSGKRRRRPQVSDTPAARKRSRNPSKWIVNVRKEAKNAGKSYTTCKGKEMPAKVMGPPCDNNCYLKCCEKVTEEDRLKMFKQFYEEKTIKGKWEIIARLSKSEATQSHELDPISGQNRSCSRQYFFVVKKQQVRVCRKMFLSTLSISESTVKTVYQKLGDGSKISPDKRGGHNNRPHAIPILVRQSVLNHINSFPRVASHLCRAETTFEYLEPEVASVSNMYRLYKEWCTTNNFTEPASERRYRDIFNHTPGLKIAFFSPKKDQCDVCFTYNHLSPEEKILKKEEHDQHLKMKQIPREMKDKDREFARKKTDQQFCAAVFDLQKVLFTPKCNAGELYYRRKLSNYNFTVYDLGKKECFCYCWHEAIAKRGSNEISSCLMKFLMKRIGEGFNRFHLYCDNCSGQNKNRMVYAMLMHIANKFQVDITLRFLLTGHTQNEGDGAHAIIELNSRMLEMFEPEDWWSYIENVKQTGEKFKLCRLSQDDIFDFHSFVDNLSDWNKNTDGDKPPWAQMQEISFSKQEPWIIQYRCDLTIEEKKSVNTKRVHRGHPVNLATHKFPKAYRGPLPVSKEKLNDLLHMCNGPNPVIPAHKTAFYLTLKSGKSVRDEFYR